MRASCECQTWKGMQVKDFNKEREWGKRGWQSETHWTRDRAPSESEEGCKLQPEPTPLSLLSSSSDVVCLPHADGFTASWFHLCAQLLVVLLVSGLNVGTVFLLLAFVQLLTLLYCGRSATDPGSATHTMASRLHGPLKQSEQGFLSLYFLRTSKEHPVFLLLES